MARQRRASEPPRLRFRLRERLGLLALINLVPLGLALWLAVQWARGKIAFRQLTGSESFWLQGLAVLAVFLALASWFVVPLARWLEAWPRWHRKRGPRWLWLLPCWLGSLVAWGLRAAVLAGLLLIGAVLLL